MAETDIFTIKGEVRTARGKGELKKLREEGYVPGVCYQREEEPVALQFDIREIRGMLAEGYALIAVQWGEGEDQTRECMIREVQHHPVTQLPTHIDFMGITRGVEIQTTVPVYLVGVPAGKEEGGILQQQRDSLPISCMPRDIPRSIEVDVSGLNVNDAIHIGDLDVPNVTILEDPDWTIASVVYPRMVEEEEPEEEEEIGEVPLVGEEEEEGEAGEEGEEASEGGEE